MLSRSRKPGGHLATINDAGENDWLASTFGNTYCQAIRMEWCAIAWIACMTPRNKQSGHRRLAVVKRRARDLYNLYSMFLKAHHMYLHVNLIRLARIGTLTTFTMCSPNTSPRDHRDKLHCPEPSTFLLACAGLMCAGLFRKKFKM